MWCGVGMEQVGLRAVWHTIETLKLAVTWCHSTSWTYVDGHCIILLNSVQNNIDNETFLNTFINHQAILFFIIYTLDNINLDKFNFTTKMYWGLNWRWNLMYRLSHVEHLSFNLHSTKIQCKSLASHLNS